MTVLRLEVRGVGALSAPPLELQPRRQQVPRSRSATSPSTVRRPDGTLLVNELSGQQPFRGGAVRSAGEIASEIERMLAQLSFRTVGLGCLDPDGRCLGGNAALCRLLGQSPHELSGRAFLDLIHPDDRDGFGELLEALRRGKVTSFDQRGRYLVGEGASIRAESSVATVTDELGEVEYFVALVRDISEWRSAEEQNAQLFGFPLALIFIAGLDGYFKRVSAGYERELGWTERELLSRPFYEFVHPDDLSVLGSSIQQMAAGHTEVTNQDIRVLCKDGSYRWLAGNYCPVFEDGLMYGMAVDVTERRQAEEALGQSERRIRLIIDAAYEAFISIDGEGRIVEWNAEAERVFVWTRDEVLGRLLSDTIIPERYRAAHVEGLDRYRITGQGPLLGQRIEIEALRRDGSEFPVELTISPTHVDDRVAFNAFVRDISERRRAEEVLRAAKVEAERAREEADRANRAKSEFLSGMSHELRTPLTAILGFAQLMQLDDIAAEHLESVEQILRAGGHLLQLIDEVLDMARIEQGRVSLSIEPVHLAEVVQETLDLVRPRAGATNVRMWAESSQFDRHVLADRQRLKQVLMNLLSNALKYNRPGGTVTVSCAPIAENRLRIAVADTGPGIRPELMDRLFLPFERLGAEQTTVEGTGLGLSITKRLVELMGGEIGAESEVGRGSTFRVDLDAVEAPAEQHEPTTEGTSEAAVAAGAERTVLYVEDNLANLRLVERILARRPAVRLVATMQGSLALELAREHHPDLILLDVHLPDIDGDEVLRRLQNDPATRAIPVITVSAEATPAKIERFLAAGAHYYLTKPLDVTRFLEVIDEVLNVP